MSTPFDPAFLAVLRALPADLFVIDAAGTILAASRHVRDWVGSDPAGRRLDELLDAESWGRLTAALASSSSAPVASRFPLLGRSTLRLEPIDSATWLVWAERYPILTGAIDPLTGLGNRAYFESRIADLLAHDPTRPVLWVVLADLDRFKIYNDLRGHLAADARLTEVAAALRATVGADDAVVRFGGDEFLLAGRADSREAAVAVGLRCHEACRKALHREEENPDRASLSLGASLGAPGDRASLERLIEAADVALRRAKALGGDAIVFEPGTDQPAGRA